MKSMSLAMVLAGTLWSAAARADQCQLVDDAVASRAVKALAGNPDVIQFCEPCGDKAPGEPTRATRVTKGRDSMGEYAVVIDRREVDLAYTYVKTSPAHYENVAALAGCPTSGVSPSLRVDDATTTGVMITADATPVNVAPPPPPEPVASPPSIVVVHEANPTNWFGILLACFGASSVWTLATFAVLRRRRRVAMRPRAAELVDRSR